MKHFPAFGSFAELTPACDLSTKVSRSNLVKSESKITCEKCSDIVGRG